MKRNPKPENVAKLTPAQRQIFEAQQAEAEQADIIMQRILDVLADTKIDEVSRLKEVSRLSHQLDDLIPATCEHGHSVYLSCMGCAEIERIVFPELYDKFGNLIEEEELPIIPKVSKPDRTLN